MHRSKIAFTLLLSVAFVGCAEGPLWKAGSYVPWVQNEWAAEEEIVDTLYERKSMIDQLVESALTDEQKDEAAKRLQEIATRDSVLLIRLHAVEKLGQLDNSVAISALQSASRDPNAKIRVAAAKSWGQFPADQAVPHLQEMLGSDTDVDVRLAATSMLGKFSGPSVLEALSMALDDTNPAVQLRAMDALENSTGEQLGTSVAAWKSFISQR